MFTVVHEWQRTGAPLARNSSNQPHVAQRIDSQLWRTMPQRQGHFWDQLTQRKLLPLEIIGTYHWNPLNMIVTEDKSANSSNAPVPCSDWGSCYWASGGKEMPCTATSPCQVDDHSDPKLVATWQYPIRHHLGHTSGRLGNHGTVLPVLTPFTIFQRLSTMCVEGVVFLFESAPAWLLITKIKTRSSTFLLNNLFLFSLLLLFSDCKFGWGLDSIGIASVEQLVLYEGEENSPHVIMCLDGCRSWFLGTPLRFGSLTGSIPVPHVPHVGSVRCFHLMLHES